MAMETCWAPDRPLAVFDPPTASPPAYWDFCCEEVPCPCLTALSETIAVSALVAPCGGSLVSSLCLRSAGITHGACSAVLQWCKMLLGQNPLLHLVLLAFVSLSLKCHKCLIELYNKDMELVIIVHKKRDAATYLFPWMRGESSLFWQ